MVLYTYVEPSEIIEKGSLRVYPFDGNGRSDTFSGFRWFWANPTNVKYEYTMSFDQRLVANSAECMFHVAKISNISILDFSTKTPALLEAPEIDLEVASGDYKKGRKIRSEWYWGGQERVMRRSVAIREIFLVTYEAQLRTFIKEPEIRDMVAMYKDAPEKVYIHGWRKNSFQNIAAKALVQFLNTEQHKL